MAARMPMITTTISSSIRVKPCLLRSGLIGATVLPVVMIASSSESACLPGSVAGRRAFSLDGCIRRIGRCTHVHAALVVRGRYYNGIGGFSLPSSHVHVGNRDSVVR